MNFKLDENVKRKVAGWINEGLKLSEIQDRLRDEFGLRLTYMEVKLLLSELNLVPKDLEPQQPAQPIEKVEPTAPQKTDKQGKAAEGKVTVTVDEFAQPGTLVSGRVTFSDGQSAEWYIDEMGRVGLAPTLAGYRPSQADLAKFQEALKDELSKMGLF